jgi:hypothetical protein
MPVESFASSLSSSHGVSDSPFIRGVRNCSGYPCQRKKAYQLAFKTRRFSACEPKGTEISLSTVPSCFRGRKPRAPRIATQSASCGLSLNGTR